MEDEEGRLQPMYSIYDAATGEFSTPMPAVNDIAAERYLLHLLLHQEQTMIAVDDLVLYYVGEFKPRQGRFVPNAAPHRRLTTARSLLNAWQRSAVDNLKAEEASDGPKQIAQ